MQVNMKKPYSVTNFQGAFRVQGVNINGKYYNQKHKDTIHNVAKVLYTSIHENTLSSQINKKACEIFYDYRSNPFIKIARTGRCSKYQQEIVILTADDALRYYDLCSMEKNTDSDNTESQWFLKKLLAKNWKNKIIISADKKNGDLTITDIVKITKKH